MLRRHRIPCKDMKQLMGQVEVTAARDLMPIDQDRIRAL